MQKIEETKKLNAYITVTKDVALKAANDLVENESEFVHLNCSDTEPLQFVIVIKRFLEI